MPRDANGNYSLPAGNPVVTGTPIESAGWGNPTMSDLAAEVTNSLDRAGRGPMTGQLKAIAGTAGAPGLTWAIDLDSGWYRAGVADYRFSIDGADFLTLNATSGLFKSAGQIRSSNNGAALQLEELDGPTNEKVWSWQCEAGDLYLRARDDSFAGGSTPVRIQRTGTTIDEFEINATLIDVNGVLDVSSTIELGHASDTTLARASAGEVSVEGKRLLNTGDASVLTSGTFTPTYTEESNFDTLTGDGDAGYIRVGSIVTFSGQVSVNITTGGSNAGFNISLPVASNFSAANQAWGTLVFNCASNPAYMVGEVESDATSNDIRVVIRSDIDAAAITVTYTIMYQVI